MQSPESRMHKVEKIFKRFDVNGDRCLNREEMAALVIAVNPRVKFSDEQIRAILDEVFKTYADFIEGEKGLSFDGLLRTYDDGAGDVDRDFDALGLDLEDSEEEEISGREGELEAGGNGEGGQLTGTFRNAGAAVSIADERAEIGAARRRQNLGAWATSPGNGIKYEETWRLIEDLDILLRRAEAKIQERKKAREEKKKGVRSIAMEMSGELRDDVTRRGSEELGAEYPSFLKSLVELRQKADASRTTEEAFDAHMAMGRTLTDHRFYEDALFSFQRGTELKPTDVRAHFQLGITFYSLGRFSEARAAYELSLEAAQSSSSHWSTLLPQIHVNLGIAKEGEGMLLSACEHYREAAILNPGNYRALKLLGSALFGVGEYLAAEKALLEAIFLKPDYADAHCDLGSVLHAFGNDERAIAEFQRAIDLKPDHMDALYNLGGLMRDAGRYERAAELYSKVLSIKPLHWQAQLNRGVALLGVGDVEEARKAFKEAFKMTNRVELYDAIIHLKHMQKRPKGLSTVMRKSQENPSRDSGSIGKGGTITAIIPPSAFRRTNAKTTPRQWISSALDFRAFQQQTKLNRCNVMVLTTEILAGQLPLASGESNVGKLMRKADLEKILQRMLPFLGAEVFQASVKAINEKILNVLDRTTTGRVDIGMFLAIIAPLCAGTPDKRKRAVFDILVWRASKGMGAEIPRADAKIYIKLLRLIYMPFQGTSELWEVHDDDEQAHISYSEFLEMFDDPDWAFGLMITIVKLEKVDRIRHSGQICSACSYTIVGPRFKEVRANFSLCSICYSEGKVPADVKQNVYRFTEYLTEADAVKDKLKICGSRGSEDLRS
ncbi:hypothetical protein O6H91_09G120400 [Diphasiastrum complanatum]|uniref:Uncharacterized protein n=2 Tax=Diphasiastrum complanatum TaxID=34168 RepID=A0ACC2CTY1_DIPCM|nr:hypothetical protein O6H91_09G067500 [Diphasiastrum complanatum]KAJ7545451.1 hypothetical protein O6H91_09G120400 [Diphasiastrum complanatum]